MAFASIGLPGLNGFVGEFLILLGSYVTLPGFAVVAAAGVVLAAVYLLWAYERVFTGPVREENQGVRDVELREIALLAPLVALVILLGIYPRIALDRITPSTELVLERIERSTDYEAPYPGRVSDVAGGVEG